MDDELTPRERDVITCIARGYSYEEARAILGISRKTVQAHLRNIYRKLDAQSATHAVAILLRDGVLSADDISANVREAA